jgi:ribosomal protein L3 glutamine methyltransferase
MKTLGEWLEWVHQTLNQAELYYGHGTDNPWDEAVCLVLCACGLPVDAGEEVLQRPVSQEEGERIRRWVQARVEQRVPLPYITGRSWFAGLEFPIRPGVLIPRSPIAELIEKQFRPWLDRDPKTALDLCTGGGCIAVALAVYFPELLVDAVDLEHDAVELARQAAALHGVEDRVLVHQGDLFAPVSGKRFDLIVSNPPYVDAEDMAMLPAEYRHEPEIALASGEDGLDLVRRMLREAREHLNPGGLLVVEVGNSAPALEQAFPRLPFIWIDFEHGGDGVFCLYREDLP